jgi:hypothetical protein
VLHVTIRERQVGAVLMSNVWNTKTLPQSKTLPRQRIPAKGS